MTNKDVNPETLEFIFNYTKEAPERQIKDAEALDNKMAQIFSVASVVIGLVGVSSVSGRWTNLLLAAALISYLVAATVALFQLIPKAQNRSLHADKLWSTFWQKEVYDVQHSLVDDISKAYSHNLEVLKKKSLTLKVVLGATAAEVLFIGIALILSRFT